MEYYVWNMSRNVKNPLYPYIKETMGMFPKFEDLKEYSVGYYEKKRETEKPDILMYPVFMVTQEIRDLIRLYDETVEVKGIQLFRLEKKPEPILYYAIRPAEIDCLHPLARVNPNGTIDHVVLDRQKLPEADIFRLGRVKQDKIVVSLRFAESLLRRKLYGIGLEKVEIL